jgi:hypothetical protein
MRWLLLAAALTALPACSEVPFTCSSDQQCTDDGVAGWC